MDTTLIKTRIFTAPAGWGKTRRAQSLANFLHCTSVVDEWSPGQHMPPGALLLTNIKPDDLFKWASGQTEAPPVVDVWRRFASPEEYLGEPTTPAAPPEPKLCINCTHHVADPQGPMCSHPEHVFRSVVTGQILLTECRDARGRAPYARHHEVTESRCGLEGQFFEEQAISASTFEQPTSEPL